MTQDNLEAKIINEQELKEEEITLERIFQRYDMTLKEVGYIMSLVGLDELTEWYNRRKGSGALKDVLP